jgi:uncharacterized protein YndB with AHSA1/START domain
MAVSDQNTNTNSGAKLEAEPHEFVITRSFDAPRELVFAAWTQEQHLKQWYGPKGLTIPVCRLNLVPGGIFHYCMRAPNGSEMWGKWTFQEIVAPKRIVLINTFSNKHGNPTRHPYVADWPIEILTTTTFIEVDGQTGLKIAWSPVNASKAEIKIFDSLHGAMTEGWNGTLDQLAEHLAAVRHSETEV